jgi:hypothetical protein
MPPTMAATSVFGPEVEEEEGFVAVPVWRMPPM